VRDELTMRLNEAQVNTTGIMARPNHTTINVDGDLIRALLSLVHITNYLSRLFISDNRTIV